MNLRDFQDEASRMATGLTKQEAHDRGICIECKQPEPLSRCHTEAAQREYWISGYCGECWDRLFPAESEE